MAEWPMTTT